ncbi:hypothetical protein AgCh_002320 [Apium graveolens]
MILLSSELLDAKGDGEAAAKETVLEDPSFRGSQFIANGVDSIDTTLGSKNRRLVLSQSLKSSPFEGDRNCAERIANVLTSIPFVVLGYQAPRKNLNCKLYAHSLIGVGVASSLYHASRGRLRKYLRWADYATIATATVCLSRALRDENPKLLMAASALVLPIQPLMVSAVHTGMMEIAFAKRALNDPKLKKAHNVHKMSSLLGVALFMADDAFPQTPFLHAGWHLAAAIGVSTCNKLLE